jgi:hypothetical protein
MTLPERSQASHLARTFTALSILVFAASGCVLGRSLATFEPARSPMGISVGVEALGGRTFTGELLAVTDSGLLMRVDDRIAFVYGDAMYRLKPASGGTGFYVAPRDFRTIPSVQQLIPLSRFPAGIGKPVLAQLLNACSQQVPEPVRPPPSR